MKCTNGTCTGSVSNEAPQASNDAYSTVVNQTLQVSAPGVLQNDNDPDGNPLRAEIVTPPSHGTLTLRANGSFTYTPAADYSGSDSFTYAATDSHGEADNATVTLNVYPVPAAPALSGPATQTITSDNTPSFSWQSTTHAASYQIQIDNGNGFISPEQDVTQAGTTFTPPSWLTIPMRGACAA
ncbi:MAG: Ig-like domain-containing protein [Candidatus Methylomirabilis sp.]|nr:Ig-like domain-containing protein [Candidatus Methylomirabilis sp.]